MPTNRIRRKRESKDPLTPALRAFFETGADSDEIDETAGLFTGSDEKLLRLWQAHRDKILAGWIEEHPGTRPWVWWVVARVLGMERRPFPGGRIESEGAALQRMGKLAPEEAKRIAGDDLEPVASDEEPSGIVYFADVDRIDKGLLRRCL